MKATTLTTLVIESLRRKFVDDGDVFHVWQAYQQSRQGAQPLPDWVADYFDSCAAALLTGTPALEALKLPRQKKGGRSKFTQRQTARRHREICSVIEMRMELTRDDLPDDADLTPAVRVKVKRWFAPLLKGETKLQRICEDLADDMKLSARTLHNIYLSRKSQT